MTPGSDVVAARARQALGAVPGKVAYVTRIPVGRPTGRVARDPAHRRRPRVWHASGFGLAGASVCQRREVVGSVPHGDNAEVCRTVRGIISWGCARDPNQATRCVESYDRSSSQGLMRSHCVGSGALGLDRISLEKRASHLRDGLPRGSQRPVPRAHQTRRDTSDRARTHWQGPAPSCSAVPTPGYEHTVGREDTRRQAGGPGHERQRRVRPLILRTGRASCGCCPRCVCRGHGGRTSEGCRTYVLSPSALDPEPRHGGQPPTGCMRQTTAGAGPASGT